MEIRTSRLKPANFSGETLRLAVDSAIGVGKYSGFISRLDKVIVLVFNDDVSPDDINTALMIAESADLSKKTEAELQDEADRLKTEAVLNGETVATEDLVSAIRYLAKRTL